MFARQCSVIVQRDMIKLFKIYLISLVLACSISILVLGFFSTSLDQSRAEFQQMKCGRQPQDSEIFTDNLIWQVLETSFGFIYLLNAYVDERWGRRIIRINVIAPKLNNTGHKLFCQFWDDRKSEPRVVEAIEFQNVWFNSE
jgi:hypothetical protein